MTQDEIIRLAREAGWDEQGNRFPLFNAFLERFAALVAAHECNKHELVGAVIEAFTEKPTDKSVTPEYLDWMRGKSCVGGNEAWNAGVAYEREKQADISALPIIIEAAVKEAVLAEREACIEKCKPFGLTGECVAIAIRAR